MGRVFGIPFSPWDKSKGQWLFGGAIAISLLMHTMVWAALVNHAERQLADTEETPIMVDLVPPPEQETPEPQTQQEEPPAQQEEPEEQQAQPEEPSAQPEEQQKSEDQVAELPQAIPTLQPVIEYAEKDSGPRIDLDGASEQESVQPEPSQPEQADAEQVEAELGEPKQDEPEQDEPVQDDPEQDEPEQNESEQAEPSANEAEETQEADNGPPVIQGDEAIETSNAEESSEKEPSEQEASKQEPLEQELPEQEQSPSKPETSEVADTEVAPEGSDTEASVVTLVTPKPRPARKRVAARRNTATAARRKTGNSGRLTRATRLFSREALADPRVRTAMRGIPRSDRVNMLCGTEMRGQLGAARPPRPPEFLPTFRLPRGTVLQPRQAAFRSRGQWYNFTFRCEVDKAATKVLKFSYRIGSRIPPADWARRGLPNF